MPTRRSPDCVRTVSALRRRRRGDTLLAAIHQAVLAELREHGFAGLTMEAVAARARTGKASLYRRWPCKEALVLDSFAYVLPSFDDPPDTGSLREDLLAVLRRMAEGLRGPLGAGVCGLSGDQAREPELVELLRRELFEPRTRMVMEVLQRGVERGEVRADAVTSLHAGVGPVLVLQHFLEEDRSLPDAHLVRLVDAVLLPMLRPAPVPATR